MVVAVALEQFTKLVIDMALVGANQRNLGTVTRYTRRGKGGGTESET